MKNKAATIPSVELWAPISRILLTSVFGLLTGVGAQAADVEGYRVRKQVDYEQLQPGSPVLLSYTFEANVGLTTNGFGSTGTLQLPSGTIGPFAMNGVDELEFYVPDGFPSAASLDASYPAGAYTIRLDTPNDGAKTLPIDFPDGAFPNAPEILDWESLGSLDSQQDLVLRWAPFEGGTAADYIEVQIEYFDEEVFGTADFGEPGALDGTATSVTIPRGTFRPGTTYDGQICFVRIVTLDTNTSPGVVGIAQRESENVFLITTELQVVNIPDPVLEEAIRVALCKPAGDITAEDMERLTALEVSDPPIPVRSLEGLQSAINLTELTIAADEDSGLVGMEVDDLAPVAGLIKLTALDLSFDVLTNASLLSGLTNLTFLDLGGNRLTDVSFLENFINLTALALDENGLTSLSLPPGLTNLTYLNLGDNGLTDFSFLADFINLTELDLNDNEMTSLSLPSSLTNLTSLHLEDTGLTNFSFLAGFIKLTELDLDDNGLTNLSLPLSLTKLTSLDLFPNPLTDLSVLTNFVNLTELDLDDNGFTSLTLPLGLTDLTNLTSLELEGNQLTDFSFLANFVNLTELDLEGNQLTSLDLPSGLTNLTVLDLGDNALTNFSFLADFINLTELELEGNQLTSLSLPPGLTNLTVLDLSGNRLTNFSFLADFISLTELDLGGNGLTTLSLPASLSGLAELDLSGNPLTEAALPAGIEDLSPTVCALRNDGVQVTLFPVMRTPRRMENGDFTFDVFADAGPITVLRSPDPTNPTAWADVGMVTITIPNFPGEVFTDTTTEGLDQAFYRVRQ